jgi:hypothetical protein
MTVRDYTLTDEEYDAIVSALEFAEDEAIMEKTEATFHNLRWELHEQYIAQDGRSMTVDEDTQ